MLFDELMSLSATNDAFYYSDQDITINNTTYTVRSFNYRIAPYSLFSLPSALESRGTAFYTVKDTNNWQLFTRSFRKFFNLGEGVPAETYTKLPPVSCYQKLDGSIILVGCIDNILVCKSKSSIASDHAKLAQSLIEDSDTLLTFCFFTIDVGYTPVFELVGPSFPIVLRYPSDTLVLLGLVHNKTGDFVTKNDIYRIPHATEYTYTWEDLAHIKETSTPNIEGFVVTAHDGTMLKVKVDSYITLHNLRDTINNKKELTRLILSNMLDDLFSIYQDSPETLTYITAEQERISAIYNHLVSTVEAFYTTHSLLSRKDYAVAAQQVPTLMSLLMARYLSTSPVDYQTYIIKNRLYE